MARKAAPAAEETSVYEQLFETATSIDEDFKSKLKKENDQAYMQRLIDCLDDIEPDAWEAMSAEAQEWFNSAVAQSKAEDEIDYPDGYEPAEEEVAAPAKTSKKPAEQLAEQVTKRQSSKAAKAAAAAEEEAEEEAEKPKTKAASGKAGAKPAAKAAKPSNGAARPMGAVAMIQQYMVKNPTHTADQVAKHLAKQGREDVQASTITVTRGGVLSVLRFAKEAGLLAE